MMIISNEDRENIMSLADSLNIQFEIRRYSGRGMYGKECFGVVTNKPGIVATTIFMALTDKFDEEVGHQEKVDLLFELSKISQDSMGLHTIVYFPDISLEDEDD